MRAMQAPSAEGAGSALQFLNKIKIKAGEIGGIKVALLTLTKSALLQMSKRPGSKILL